MFNEATPDLFTENGMLSTIWIRELKIKKAIDQETCLRLQKFIYAYRQKKWLIDSIPLIAVRSVKLMFLPEDEMS